MKQFYSQYIIEGDKIKSIDSDRFNVSLACRDSLANRFIRNHPNLFNQPENKFTYVIFDGRLYKIGVSENPELRLRQILVGNPHANLILKTKNVTEKFLHAYFADKRVSREWFELSDKDLEKLQSLTGKVIDSKSVAELHFKFHSNKRVSLNEKYIIKFGKYKGVKIVDMVSSAQIQYVEWFVGAQAGQSKNFFKKDSTYKAFRWWLNNHQDYINNQNNKI